MVISFNNGSKLSDEYRNFLKTIIEEDKIWLLLGDGKVSVIETDENICTTLWSSGEMAEKSKADEWNDFEVQSLTVAEFVSLCIPDLLEGDIDALIEFHEGEGIYRDLLTLEEDIYDEAERQGVALEEKCEEFENFIEANDTYEDFIADVIEAGRLWILVDEEDNVVLADVEEDEVLPVWTSESEALFMCTEEWENCRPEAILVRDFLEDWIPMLEEDDTNIMFDITEDGGMGTAAAIVAEDLKVATKLLHPVFDNVVQFPGNRGED